MWYVSISSYIQTGFGFGWYNSYVELIWNIKDFSTLYLIYVWILHVLQGVYNIMILHHLKVSESQGSTNWEASFGCDS